MVVSSRTYMRVLRIHVGWSNLTCPPSCLWAQASLGEDEWILRPNKVCTSWYETLNEWEDSGVGVITCIHHSYIENTWWTNTVGSDKDYISSAEAPSSRSTALMILSITPLMSLLWSAVQLTFAGPSGPSTMFQLRKIQLLFLVVVLEHLECFHEDGADPIPFLHVRCHRTANACTGR